MIVAQGRPQGRLICASLAHLIDGGELGRGGALEAIASKPFGYVLLWIITIGFAGLALWRLVQAAGGVPV